MATVGSQIKSKAGDVRRGVGTLGKKAGLGGPGLIGFGISTGLSYLHYREGSITRSEAVGKALVQGAAWAVAPQVMMVGVGFSTARAAASAFPTAYRMKEAHWNQYFKPNLGGNYVDTQQALTMRQAGIQAIQGSRLNARSALGNEAGMMHRA